MTQADLLAALGPVIDAFENLGIPHFIGGSVASSVHGLPRTSIDADVVADLRDEHVAAFVQRLAPAFYLNETRIRAAILARRSFNLIHLATMFKIDVFVSKRRPFDSEVLRRAATAPLDDSPASRLFKVASREDIVLAKLEWFRAGGEVSERQWADVIGVLRGGSRLEGEYLERWATELGLEDLLERARQDASRSG